MKKQTLFSTLGALTLGTVASAGLFLATTSAHADHHEDGMDSADHGCSGEMKGDKSDSGDMEDKGDKSCSGDMKDKSDKSCSGEMKDKGDKSCSGDMESDGDDSEE